MQEQKLFWDHLDDMRAVIFRLLAVCIAITIAYFVAMPHLFDSVILAPCNNDFILYELLRSMGERLSLEGAFFSDEFNVELVNIELAAPFFIHISTAFYLAVVTAVPYIFFEFWSYIAPALYQRERSGLRRALVMGGVMFFVGVATAYFVIYPLTLRFLSTYQLSSTIDNIISLTSYIDNFMMLILMMGLAFEIPLVLWLLSIFGIVSRDMLSHYRRHAIVVVVIVAAIITPTSDPFTLTVVAIPLYMLYELSLLMVRKSDQ